MDTSTQATLLNFVTATKGLSVPSELLQPHDRARVVTPGEAGRVLSWGCKGHHPC